MVGVGLGVFGVVLMVLSGPLQGKRAERFGCFAFNIGLVLAIAGAVIYFS